MGEKNADIYETTEILDKYLQELFTNILLTVVDEIYTTAGGKLGYSTLDGIAAFLSVEDMTLIKDFCDSYC